MKDTMQIFLQAVYNMLNGTLSYNGQNVPVFDKKRYVTVPAGLYVILGSQRESDDPQTSDAFITTTELDIEIWHVTGYEVSSDGVNTVSDQLLQILMSMPEADNFPAQNLFQISGVRRISASLQDFSIGPTDTVLNKNITIQATIVQQFP